MREKFSFGKWNLSVSKIKFVMHTGKDIMNAVHSGLHSMTRCDELLQLIKHNRIKYAQKNCGLYVLDF